MSVMSEALILGCLISGLGITTLVILNKAESWEISLSDALLQALELYKIQIIALLVTLISVLVAAYFFQKRRYTSQKVSLNCTKKMSLDEYERMKADLTADSLKKLVESEAYKKYLDDKNNGRLKDIELKDADRIVLSDDSSVADEDENVMRRQ